MTRRFSLILALLVWVLIGKAMAFNQSQPSLALKACVERTLDKQIVEPFALSLSPNLEMNECPGQLADCHLANFKAVAADGVLYKGQISVIADSLGNCHLANEVAHPLTLVNAKNESARLADE